MGAPFPPQGQQKQYTERPLKIYGEQVIDGEPLPIGVRTTTPAGDQTPPFVITSTGIYQPVNVGDWIISNRYTGALIEAVSDEEFSERFGGGGGPNVMPADEG